MLLTSRQMKLIEAYKKGEVSTTEKEELNELDALCFEMYGEHVLPKERQGDSVIASPDKSIN